MPVKNPVMISSNVYLDGARPFDRETGAVVSEVASRLQVHADGGRITVGLTLFDDFDSRTLAVPTTADLGRVRFPDLDFEAPDATPIQLGTDLLGCVADGPTVAGPIYSLVAGHNSVVVWG